MDLTRIVPKISHSILVLVLDVFPLFLKEEARHAVCYAISVVFPSDVKT